MPQFTPQDREALKQKAIEKCTFEEGDLSPDQVVAAIERQGFIADGGIGSLMKGTHATGLVNRVKGTIDGFVGRFDMGFTWYGGTREHPTLMYGATEQKGGSIPCIVTQKSLTGEDGNFSAKAAIDFIDSFEKRENPPENPIYRRRFMQVHVEGQDEPIVALVCENDPDGPFVGDKLTNDEKAIIMANEWGAMFRGYQDPETDGLMRDENGEMLEAREQPAMGRTILGYMQEIMDGRLKHGLEVEEELWDLLQRSNYYREQMSPDKRTFLEALDSGIMVSPEEDERERSQVIGEGDYDADATLTAYVKHFGDDLSCIFHHVQQDKRGLDPRVFESKAGLSDLTPEEYAEKLHSARTKIRDIMGMGPVPDGPRIVRETDIIGYPPPQA